MAVWAWEEVDENRSGSAGDLSKMFRNEGVKEPGIFASNAPQADATVLAREAIQNSWDAARDLAAMSAKDGAECPPFKMTFTYRNVSKAEKAALVAGLGLEDLGERAAVNDRKALGLAPEDCLAHLHDDEPLRLLIVEEEGASGMYGPWSGAESRMYLALVSLGFTAKASGSGGSYGYGKAGLIRGSSIRSVIGYTCFRERANDPGVTRRLLGMTYWGTHKFDGAGYTGFARLGHTEADGSTRPFENEAADTLAAEFGLGVRDPSVATQLGTTFLLVDPTVRPQDLSRAIERSWWPALQEGQFEVEIVSDDGEHFIPRPKKDDGLRSFIRGFELATTAQDNNQDQEARRDLKSYRQKELGHLGLVADMAGWSYAHGSDSEEGQVDHQSLVALVRGPHMVVEYLALGRQQPMIRGTFFAHDDVDDLLRQTEPKAHDAWLSRMDEEGIDPEAPKFASEVLKRIRREVREFRKQLKPPPPREQDIRLPILDDLLKDMLENRGPKAPPPPHGDPRPVSIRITQKVEAAGSSAIRVRADVRFSLSNDFTEAERALCRLHFRYAFDEDGRLGDDCPVAVETPEGFERDEDHKGPGVAFIGELTKEPMDFEMVSEGYDPDWTGQLIVSGDVIGAEPEKVAEVGA